MDRQIGKLIARIAENLPDMEGPVVQEWIDDPLRLQGFLGGLNPPMPKSPTEPAKPIEKFGLLADLGIIEVPADYVHQAEFAGGRFPNPSWALKPGVKLWVRAHKQVVSGTTTSEERMKFLAGLGSHHVGAQGVRLVREDKKAWCQVPKGYWYASFDEKERLWLDAERSRRVPGVGVRSDGGGYFSLGSFERPWNDRRAFLSFCDVPSGT